MNHMTASCKGDDYIILMNCTIIMSHIRKWKLSPKNIIIITMWPIKYLSKWMHLLSSDQNNLRNYGFCSSRDDPWCFCPFHLTHFTALSPPHLLFAVSQTIYHGSLSWTHTCFRIQAAISCPQSKMTWNSFAFFISFRSGLASLVSVGSCRIFKRMLYRDGALISSCNRMRPADKEDTYSMKNEFYRCNNTTCLICCYFKVSLILRRPQKTTGSRFSLQRKADIHAFLFTDYWSSYSCLANKWTATDLSREFNTKQHIHALLYQRHKMEEPWSESASRKFQSHRSLPNVDPPLSSMIPKSGME